MCWIIWVFDLEGSWEYELGQTALDLLKWNKNRWQEGYWVSIVTSEKKIFTYKFQDIYDPNILEAISDIKDRVVWIIWHARYPTSWWADNSQEYMQPYSVQKRDMWFAFAFNGNIVNAEEIAEELEKFTSLKFPRPILDTGVLQEIIIQSIASGEGDTKRILEIINNKIDGQCNIALMAQDGSFALAKDRWWFRPLSYHRDTSSGLLTFSSEDRALFKIWCNQDEVVHLNTWEVLKYNATSWSLIGPAQMDLDKKTDKSRCFFEAVYFADSKTRLWWEPSNNYRYRLGQELAVGDSNKFSREDSVVVDVPASSLYSAKWYAEKLDLTHISSAITKNPESSRTFIADEETRKKKIEDKYIFNPELKKYIKWKKLIIIDDSIVRGSTLEFLIARLQEYYEPSEIHIRIPSPPIIWPCYYAINLKHPNELLASRFFENPTDPSLEEFDELADHLWTDSIRYVTKDQLIRAIKWNVQDMCLWCITRQYPTPAWQAKFDMQVRETVES